MTDAPERRSICEAQMPGKPSHEFETYGEDAARAYCDVMGWDFIRCYVEGSHSDRPEKEKNPSVPFVSAKQLKALITEAQITYHRLSDNGVITESFDDWRAKEIASVARVTSFKLLPNSKFVMVRNHFRKLRGATPLGNSHAGKRQSRESGDTLAQREQQLYLIAAALGAHARVMKEQDKEAAVNMAYLLTIARAKNKAHTIEDMDDLIKLPTSRLEQLLYTVRNRIAAKEGRGDSKNRNKNS